MFQGGFSVPLFEYEEQGKWVENKHRPRIRMKAIDSKRTLMGTTRRVGARPEEKRQVLEGLGRLLDLKHLTFALTDRHLSLAKAAETFGLEVGKLDVEEHGVITEHYIDYNRRDVEVTSLLLEAVRAEWVRHPGGPLARQGDVARQVSEKAISGPWGSSHPGGSSATSGTPCTGSA